MPRCLCLGTRVLGSLKPGTELVAFFFSITPTHAEPPNLSVTSLA